MIKCEICGREFEKANYNKPYDKVCSSDKCFGEKLWKVREEEYLNGKPFIIIDGHLWSDGGYKKNEERRYLGCSGQEFTIRMNNGTEIFTNNLWSGGIVPESHREILADNAVFVD